MGYKNAELRLGKNDTQLDDPRAGEVALRIDSTGAIFTKPEGAEEVAVGGGVPAGIDGAGASEGQVWTADGAGDADWATLTQNPSLSDYANVIVVDAGGNGDYTLLSEAVAASTITDVIWVMNSITETTTLIIDKKVTIFVPAISTEVTIPTSIISGGYLYLSGAGYFGRSNSISLDGNTNLCLLQLEGGIRVGFIDVLHNSGNLISYTGFRSSDVYVVDLGTISVNKASMSTLYIDNNLSSTSYLRHCSITATLETGGTPTIDMTHCSISGLIVGGISVETSNYSNTVNGVTWPSIVREYVARIYDTGSGDRPTVIVISNTLGYVPTWSRLSEGTYRMQLPQTESMAKADLTFQPTIKSGISLIPGVQYSESGGDFTSFSVGFLNATVPSYSDLGAGLGESVSVKLTIYP